MANAFTGTSALSNIVQAAYDKLVQFALREYPTFRTLVDVRPMQPAMPGSSIIMQRYADLAKATTALTETVDPDSVAISNTTQVTITPNEYGNAALTTRKLELYALSDVDPAIADIIAFNMVDSIDELVQTVLRGGTNVTYAGNAVSTVTIDAADIVDAADFRKIVANMRARKAIPRRDDFYYVAIHPQVSHDLRADSGAAGWVLPHQYSAPGAIWRGEIGTFEGAYFVESSRCFQATDGASSARVFRTYIAGKQALAEAVAEEPRVVVGPVVDKLERFRPIGWRGNLGWARYREECLERLESSSSINAA